MHIWKNESKSAAERANIEKLKEECYIKRRGETTSKTKTKFMENKINDVHYERKPDPFLYRYPSIVYTRALIMGRYGMLKCANNFSVGSGTRICMECDIKDDEDHRINHCSRWRSINLCDVNKTVVFDDIYSDDLEKCHEVVKTILSMWDLENGKNDMRMNDNH